MNILKNKENTKNNNSFFNLLIVIKHFFIILFQYIKKYWKIVVVILVLVIIILTLKYIFVYLYNKKYKPYETQMAVYGFDKMYNNGKATSNEKITKSEAIKVILSSIYNVYDISGFAYETNDTYSNAIWVEYAKRQGIISDDSITKDNENSNIEYIDVIKYYLDARAKLLSKPVQYSKEANFFDLKKYNTELQNYINDATENNLIENSKSKLNANKDITKGQFNQFVINFVKQYNTITLTGDKINVNPDKEPSNASEYPYILSNIDKSIYEKAFDNEDSERFANPIAVYQTRKEYYTQIKEWSEYYYNYIINIDYNNITKEKFKTDLSNYIMYGLDNDEVSNYVDYVIAHKIKLSGKATAQLPIIYYDGVDYRIRIKLEFNIENSDIKQNLLFQDLKNTKAYDYNNKNSLLIDAKLGSVYNQNSIYVYVIPISSLIIK